MEESLSAVRVIRLGMCALGVAVLAARGDRWLTLAAALPDDRPAQRQPLPTIHVSEGRYTRYYHLLLRLRPQDFELTVPVDRRQPRYAGENRYELSNEGQFEIFVPKAAFPVPAPNCARYIIVRMPATDPSSPGAAQKLERKRALFSALKELKHSGTGDLEVALELNPYVRVITPEPLQLELTQCNVFFRQADGAYTDHVGPVSR